MQGCFCERGRWRLNASGAKILDGNIIVKICTRTKSRVLKTMVHSKRCINELFVVVYMHCSVVKQLPYRVLDQQGDI